MDNSDSIVRLFKSVLLSKIWDQSNVNQPFFLHSPKDWQCEVNRNPSVQNSHISHKYLALQGSLEKPSSPQHHPVTSTVQKNRTLCKTYGLQLRMANNYMYLPALNFMRLSQSGAVLKLFNAKSRDGWSDHALSLCCLHINVNQNIDRIRYMKQRLGIGNGQYWRYITHGQPL